MLPCGWLRGGESVSGCGAQEANAAVILGPCISVVQLIWGLEERIMGSSGSSFGRN